MNISLIYLVFFCVCVHVCHRVRQQARGHVAGGGSLLSPCGSEDQTQVLGKHLHLPVPYMSSFLLWVSGALLNLSRLTLLRDNYMSDKSATFKEITDLANIIH